MAKKGTSVSVLDERGQWLLIVPVGNLALTADVRNELSIHGVTFISAAKLRRVQKRFRVDFSVLGKNRTVEDVLEPGNVLGVVHQNGTPRELKRNGFSRIREALDMLAASQLYYRRRSFMVRLGLAGECQVGSDSYIQVRKQASSGIAGSWMTGVAEPLRIDRHWKHYHRHGFFSSFLRMLSGKHKVASGWSSTIRRAVILAGRGINATDIASSFTWNMIAIEMLVSKSDDKYSKEIVGRIEAFLGWVGFWDTERFEERITELYQLRCDVVHRGEVDRVKVRHLLFSEDLLFNLLLNLLKHPRLFPDQEHVVNYAQKVAAERLLGSRRRVQPKTLGFIHRTYSETDLDI